MNWLVVCARTKVARVMKGYKTPIGAVKGFTAGNASEEDPNSVLPAGWDTVQGSYIEYKGVDYNVYGPFERVS